MRDSGDSVGARVCDNGTGITDDIRGKLFRPFFTASQEARGIRITCRLTGDARREIYDRDGRRAVGAQLR